MQLSIHYYVLSLSEEICRFYEGFREKLIDIHDERFPIERSKLNNPGSENGQLVELFRQTEKNFSYYYDQEPLRLVVVGTLRNLVIFDGLKTHPDVLIGRVEGDYIATSSHNLGKIVWPVIKETIAGTTKSAKAELARAFKKKKVVSGIDAVGQTVETDTGSTLYIEEDYHMRGSIQKADHSLIISKHVNILEVIDDVVDIIIEKVLKNNGTVIFVNNGSLEKFGRIALIRR